MSKPAAKEVPWCASRPRRISQRKILLGLGFLGWHNFNLPRPSFRMIFKCLFFSKFLFLHSRNFFSGSWNAAQHRCVTPFSIRTLINQSTNQPINQSTNQPINQSTNQPINQSTNQPINQSTNQPINQSTNQPINQSTNQPINPSPPPTHPTRPSFPCQSQWLIHQY